MGWTEGYLGWCRAMYRVEHADDRNGKLSIRLIKFLVI